MKVKSEGVSRGNASIAGPRGPPEPRQGRGGPVRAWKKPHFVRGRACPARPRRQPARPRWGRSPPPTCQRVVATKGATHHRKCRRPSRDGLRAFVASERDVVVGERLVDALRRGRVAVSATTT